MSIFHSSVSRREFMKNLGLTGAGLGAFAVAAPTFHDLDELMGAPTSTNNMPWYVKERELLNPTTDVDWDVLKRADNRYNVQGQPTRSFYPSFAGTADRSAKGDARREKRYADDEPGYDLKWRALQNGRSAGGSHPSWGHAGLDEAELKKAPTPAEMNKPNWTGTPEEASRLVMAAIRYYGMALVGFAELDATYRNKLVMEYTSSGNGSTNWDDPKLKNPEAWERYLYKDQPKATREKTSAGGYNCYIPTKPVSLILFGCPQTPEARKTNAIIANTNATIPDNFHGLIEARLSKFLRSLGDYQLFGNSGHQSMPVTAGVATCLTGVGEQARQNNYALSLEVGPNYNPLTLMTDLVLAPTNPIDAGMWKFCHSCAICAKQCPSGSISLDKEPSYEIPLTEGKKTTYKNPGPKLFWSNIVGCRNYTSEFDGCAPKDVLGDHGGGRSCFGVCPFGEDRAAMAHNLIRSTSAITSVFNGFFASMADVFGTGRAALRPDDWWDMGLPAHGSPTHIRATKGQWKM